jgi:hypothetical protein
MFPVLHKWRKITYSAVYYFSWQGIVVYNLVGKGLLNILEDRCSYFFCTRRSYADVLLLSKMVSF